MKRRWWQSLTPDLLTAAIELASVGAVGVGLWWVHPSAALIGVGGLILVASIWGRRKGP